MEDQIHQQTRPVVLIHGLFMGAWAMCWLARRLRRAGLDTYCFGYPSLRCTPAENARRLERRLAAFDGPVDLIAHSLGGIVVAQLLARTGTGRIGRIVLLGAPLRGSVIARRLSRFAITRWLLGRSVVDGLLDDHRARFAGWKDETGLIVGVRRFGVGYLLGGFDGPNDGTVAVAETDLPGATDRIELPLTHLGLLFSPRVARQARCFLRHGCFCRQRVE